MADVLDSDYVIDTESLKNNIEDIGITAQGLGSLNYPSGKLSLG